MQIGAILAGRFLIERAASSEDQGLLHATDRVLGGAVSLRLVEVPRGDAVDRFLLEAASLAALDHPALARHVAHGHLDGQLYLAAAHVEGEALHQRLLRGPLPPDEALRLVARVTEAADHAHRRGVGHLDLHPRRLILRGDSSSDPVLSLPGGAWLAATARPPFAPDESPYLDPERLTGVRPGPATDSFGLGVLLYCCLAGHPPFLGATPLASQAKILLDAPPRLPAAETPWPPRLAALVASLLARDPAARPADLAQLALTLRDPALLDPAPPPSERTALSLRERRLASLLVVGDPRADLDLGPARPLLARAHRIDLAGRVLLAAFLAPSLPESLDAAAHAAVAIRERIPEVPLALATGYTTEGGDFPSGEALDRVAALAHADAPDGAMGRRRRAIQASLPYAIRLDALSGALLGPRWAIEQDDFGFALGAERPGPPIAESEAPPELPLALDQHRLEALSPCERRLLRAVSLLDRPFDRELIEAIAGPGLDEAWDSLLARAFLQVDERSLASPAADRQVRYRPGDEAPARAARGSLFDDDRKLGHRLAARWLADHGAAPDERLVHLEAAGDRDGAQAACLHATRASLARGDLDEALGWTERGEEFGDRGSSGALHGLRAQIHRWLGQPILARKAALRSIEVQHGAVDLTALGEIIDASALIGDGRRVQGVTRRLQEIADPVSRARSALALFALGYPDLADEQLSAATLAIEPGPRARAWLLRARALRAQLSGFPAARLALCRAARAAFAEADEGREALAEEVHLAFAHLDLGLDVHASTLAGRAVGQARHAGLGGVEALGKVALGLCLGRIGSFDEARATLREAAAFFSGRGSKAHEGRARIALATVLLAAGDHERARREAERACLVLDPVPPLQVHALSVHGQSLLAGGENERALDLARSARAIAAARRGMVEGSTLATLVEATALHLSDQRPAALAMLTEAEQNILAQAATIADPAHAQAYLRGVPEHARILDLARLWSALPGPADGADPAS